MNETNLKPISSPSPADRSYLSQHLSIPKYKNTPRIQHPIFSRNLCDHNYRIINNLIHAPDFIYWHIISNFDSRRISFCVRRVSTVSSSSELIVSIRPVSESPVSESPVSESPVSESLGEWRRDAFIREKVIRASS